MMNVIEMKNSLQELIKGTSLEPYAKLILAVVKPPKGSDFINKQDNNLTTKIMHSVLKKHSNCIDVGCNTGDFLRQITQLAPLGYHYAFEPIPRLAKRLRKRFPHTDVRQIALSDSEVETTFWYVANSPALSSLKRQSCDSHIPNALTEPITVKTQKLDNILLPEFKIDFIKVDVEGAELEVFRGAIRTLKTHKPCIVFEHGLIDSEAWPNVRYHDGRIYDLLVNECELQIFELRSWLEGLAPLSRDEFLRCYAWNFLAIP